MLYWQHSWAQPLLLFRNRSAALVQNYAPQKVRIIFCLLPVYIVLSTKFAEITYCPNKDPIADCTTCCCDSSEDLEFYNPDIPEPWCSAPPAIYTVRFVGTWTEVCQPDYYPSNAHWSPPTGASHDTSYQMWDACMDDPSDGVARVSQTGDTSIIEGEYEAAGDSILDTFRGSVISGGGVTESDLSIDKYHQWVSTVSMLAPSRDRMVGVANLRLCDGNDWKRSVKVCSELFSTATASDRVHPPMQRNTVQWNNCSFGYFTFTFKEYSVPQNPPEDCEHNCKLIHLLPEDVSIASNSTVHATSVDHKHKLGNSFLH